jgi:hypothetical protein
VAGIAPLLFLVVVAAVAAGGVYLYHRVEQRRRAAASALAASHGFEIDVGPKDPPPLPFDLFDLGKERRVSYQIWRHGSQDSAFQYRYVTGSGDDRRTHERSCALVELPFSAPHLTIGPEGFWSSIGRVVGLRDIEVESPRFNDRYRVRCADERFAITLLDQRMIGWMLSPHAGGGSVRFELGGRWMLCWCDGLEFRELFGLLGWAQHAREHLPPVLRSLYPPT